jgi:hypothetical protein
VCTRGSILRCFALRAASAALAAASAGCLYSFSAGGGLPRHIRTIAVLPLDNQTTQFTLTQELTQALLDGVTGRLGLQPAGEARADAVLRGRILSYRNEPLVFQGAEGGRVVVEDQRRVTITVQIEIYDAVENRILWQAASLSASGEYRVAAGEEAGRAEAVRNLVQKVIDGAQSQW